MLQTRLNQQQRAEDGHQQNGAQQLDALIVIVNRPVKLKTLEWACLSRTASSSSRQAWSSPRAPTRSCATAMPTSPPSPP